MALNLGFNPVTPPPNIEAGVSNYRTVYDFTHQYAPDLAEELMQIRSRDSLSGFLDAMAMSEGISADSTFWAEEGERHVIHESNVARAGDVFTLADHKIRPGIKISIQDVANNLWALARVESTTSTTFTARPYGYANFNAIVGLGTTGLTVLTAGSEWKKGSDGQQVSLTSQLDTYSNKLIIESDTYKNNNSDLSNRTWFHKDGNWFWVDLQFEETLVRYADELELSSLISEKTAVGSALAGEYDGTEGYFTALRNRGITSDALITSATDLKNIIKSLDKVHGESTYMGYLGRDQEFAFDDIAAGLNAKFSGGLDYGVFANGDQANGKNKAINLGFEGFRHGGYNFFYQTWKVLKDPTKFGSAALAASGKIHGVLFPYGNTQIESNPAISGMPPRKVPYLTLMFKEMPGYSRKLEKWFIGSGRIATPTTDGDYIKFNLRSERCLRTVGARKQILITG